MADKERKTNFELGKYFDELCELEQDTAFFLHAALAMFESEDTFDTATLLGMRQQARSIKQKFIVNKEVFSNLTKSTVTV